jgi:hypothetical protein
MVSKIEQRVLFFVPCLFQQTKWHSVPTVQLLNALDNHVGEAGMPGMGEETKRHLTATLDGSSSGMVSVHKFAAFLHGFGSSGSSSGSGSGSGGTDLSTTTSTMIRASIVELAKVMAGEIM